MYKLSLLFAACAALAPFVQADTISDVCGASNKGTFCSNNATALISCATKSQVTCGANEFCQVQGPRIARCEPVTKDAENVCEAAATMGLRSAIRCSNEVPNVRVSCPNALISRCPTGKVCVQSNSRYARCETPAYTREYAVIETFTADVEPSPISHMVPITATTFLPTTTTFALTATVVTTEEPATTTLGMQTDSGFPTTLPNVVTSVVPIQRTRIGLTTIVIPTTIVEGDYSTILQTATETIEPTPEIPIVTPVQTITNTLTKTVTNSRSLTTLLSTTQGFITEVETMLMSSTLVDFPTIATTPLMTLTETVVNTPTVTLAPEPDLTLTVTETNHVEPTIISTPFVTMTSTEVLPTVQIITDVATATQVYPEIVIVPTTQLYTIPATAEVVAILPTTIVDMSTQVLQATPLVTIVETNPVTFTPTATDILPTSEVMTSMYTSMAPGTTILSQTAVSTNINTWTNMATIVSEASSTVAVPMSTLIPTIATDTFIVCNTPIPTFSQGIPKTFGLTLTASPVPVTASPIVTRTRGPNVARTQTTVIAGTPTISSDSGSGDNIPMFGLFSRHHQNAQPAAIKIEGACTTSYRVKFGYSTAPVTATDVFAYPVTAIATNVAQETEMATSVAYQTEAITAKTLPITVPYTSSMGVYTTAYPVAPSHTLDIVSVIQPTIIEYTPEPFPVTQVNEYTTTMAFPTDVVFGHVYSYTEVNHVTEQVKSTVLAYLPIPTEPVSTILQTEVPTLTQTLPALTTFYPTFTSTMPQPTTLVPEVTTTVEQKPITSVAQYMTKVTKVITNVGVATETSVLASPTVISTRHVFPPIVQVTVTATATADEAAVTEVSSLTRVQPVTSVLAPIATTMTRVNSNTAVQTAVYTATSTSVHASTMLSTRTFNAMPTGNLVAAPRLQAAANVSVIDISTNTVVVSQTPPATQVSSLIATSTGMVTVTSVVSASATSVPVIADASSTSGSGVPVDASGSSDQTTTLNQVATVTSTLAAPEPTFTIMPFPNPAPASSGSCPSSFDIEGKQYRLTVAGTEADGEAACAAIGAGWVLADITDAAEHEAIGNNVCATTYYRSWLNNDYGATCLTMIPGGATVVPAEGCAGIYPSLCKLEA